MISDEVTQHCKDLVTPPAVSMQVHGSWTVFQYMREGLLMTLVELTNITALLPPSLMVGIRWQGFSKGTESELSLSFYYIYLH